MTTVRSARGATACLVGVVGAAVATRFVGLRHGLPHVLGADEPVVLERAQQLLDLDLPTQYDWPTGAMALLAGWLTAIGQADAEAPYAAARVLFAVISLALVIATGVLAAALVRRERRLATAAVAMAAMVVAYPALRLGRVLHPDPLQSLLIVVSLLCTVRLTRDPRWRWIVAAGGAAGLAAGTKYLGGIVALPLAVALLTQADVPLGDRLRRLAGAAAAAVAAFVVAVPAALWRPLDLSQGLEDQLLHQSGGHLGYEGDGPSFWWHVATALPGTWGWAWTVVAVAALAWTGWRGTAAQRIVALHVGAAYLVVAWGVVRFPHYVLVYLPALAALAAVAFDRVVEHVPSSPARRGALRFALVAVLLVVPATHALRLLRAETARDTRTVAASVARSLPGPIVKEQYTDASSVGRSVARLAHHPELVTCGCVVEISSYNEDRYRRRPDRHADAVAVYDALRARGRVLHVVRPTRTSSYRWDVLPQWGLDRIPLTGAVGTVGPTITFLEVPGPGAGRPAGQSGWDPRMETKLTISPG